MPFVKATPYARKIAKQYHIDLTAVTPTGPHGAVLERDVIRAREGRQKLRQVPVTPLAQRIAESMHVDLDLVRGTGIGGKISKADVLEAARMRRGNLQPGEKRLALTPMRRAIAAQMTRAAAVPTVTVTTKVDVTALMAAREQHNAESRIRYSVNDLILMATAKALAKNRNLLCSFDGDGIIYKPGVDLGVAVSTDDGEGLLVPVIREADTLSADALALSAHELIKRARERTVTQGECEGSAFTVTNLGMYGVEAFTPLLNPPNAAILGVCSIYDGVAVRNGAVEVRKLLHLCLTFDHRTIDGVQAAKFNLAVREYLEHPDSLI